MFVVACRGALLVAVLCWSSRLRAQNAAGEQRTDALDSLNQQFRAAYARTRAETLRKINPLVLYDGAKLVLFNDGNREEGTALPAKYHQLKAVTHLPFTVYLETRGEADGPLSAPLRERLKTVSDLAKAVRSDLPSSGFSPSELEDQKAMLAGSISLLDRTLDRNDFRRDELEAFARSMRPRMEANMIAAAAIELDHYRVQIAAWRTKLGDEQWRRLKVVVVGSQMPRRDHRVVQLFAALLEVHGEGERIVYAEGLYEEQRALNLAATHELDADSAHVFFDDRTRLARDILADGAAKYVREQLRGGR